MADGIATPDQIHEAVDIANCIEAILIDKDPGCAFIAVGMVLGAFAATQEQEEPRRALRTIMEAIEDTAKKKMRGVLDGSWPSGPVGTA